MRVLFFPFLYSGVFLCNFNFTFGRPPRFWAVGFGGGIETRTACLAYYEYYTSLCSCRVRVVCVFVFFLLVEGVVEGLHSRASASAYPNAGIRRYVATVL